MAVEDDILRVLNKIEKAIKDAAATRPTTGGGRTQRNLVNEAQDKTRGNPKVFKAQAAAMEDLGDAADAVTNKFGRLGKTIDVTTGRFSQMNRSMRSLSRPVTAPTPAPQPQQQPQAGGGGSQPPLIQSLMNAFGGRQAGTLQRGLTSFTSGLSVAKIGAVAALTELAGAIRPVTADFFRLSARGIAPTLSSMTDLYKNAALAGMSVTDFIQTLDEAGPAVVRARSFNDFDASLDKTRTQLAGLGVFGADATKLSSTLAASATAIGIPQAQLGESMSRQVDVFAELRRSSLITSDQFKELSKNLADSQEVQGQLLGLAPQQRAAAFQDLTRTRAIGIQMGLTADASKQLGDALIAQRKLTTQQRFQAAGTIRQAGAITGLSSDQTERLSQLSLKKNRTSDENDEFARIGGQLQARLEEMQNTGDVQATYIAEQLQERLGGIGNLGEQLRASGQATATQQSGEIINKEIGANTGKTAAGVAQILTTLNGIAANPAATAVASALGSVAFTGALTLAFRGALNPLIVLMTSQNSLLGQIARNGGIGGIGAGVGGEVAGTASRTSKVLSGLSKAVPWLATIGGVAMSVFDIYKVNQAQNANDGGASEDALAKQGTTMGSAIGEGLGTVVGAGIGVAISGLVTALTGGLAAFLVPLVTGGLAAAGGWAGKLIGGLFSNDKANQASTSATKDNTAEIKKANQAKTADADVLTSTQNLTAQVVASARAARADSNRTTDAQRAVAKQVEDAKTQPIEAVIGKDQVDKLAAKARSDLESTQFDAMGNATGVTTVSEADVNQRFQALLDEARGRRVAELQQAIQTVQTPSQPAAQTPVATPIAPPPPAVTPPEVNRTTNQQQNAAQDQQRAQQQAAAAAATASPTDLTNQLATIIQLLTSSLTAEQAQLVATQALAVNFGRPRFLDNDVMVDRVFMAQA